MLSYFFLITIKIVVFMLCQLNSLGSRWKYFFRSSKLVLVSNTYERRAIRQEELCHCIDMMKCLPTHQGALEQELC